MKMSAGYPLQWPTGQEKTPPAKRERARFKVSFARARDHVCDELNRMGVPDNRIVISTNIELKRDGLPYAGRKPAGSPGVAVYFFLDGTEQVIACDRWDRVEDNLRAVGKTIEALRGIERWASSAIMQQAFAGFKSLPPSGGEWRAVFGFVSDSRPSLEHVKSAYRTMAAVAHPDKGGNPAEMSRLNQAFAAAKEELGATQE
jgi:hypothetical protein